MLPATDSLQAYGIALCDSDVYGCRLLGMKPSIDFNLHNHQVFFPSQSVWGIFISTHSRAQDGGAV